MSAVADIAVLDAPAADAALDQLASVLVDCVEGGASVSFMSPFSHAEAFVFFRKVAASVASGDTVLLPRGSMARSSARFSSGWIRRPISRTAPTR